MADVFEVEKILADRTRRGKPEYKIRWKKFGPKGDSWEPEEHLLDCEDVLKEYKAQNATKAAPTPRRSQRTKATPKPTPKPQTKVTKAAKSVKLPSVADHEPKPKPKSKKTALENDFITPRPPRATMRQRVLELEESAQKSLHQLRNKKGQDETDTINLTKATPIQKPRNRLQELKDWLEMEKQTAGSEEEGASWWIVAFCVVCFLVVVVLIVWHSPVTQAAFSEFRGDTGTPDTAKS